MAAFCALPSIAAAAAPGGFSQLGQPFGCLTDGGSAQCSSIHDSAAPYGFILSPDGKNAYSASYGGDQVLTFDRDPNTGRLTQKPGTAGCVHGSAATASCAGGRLISSPQGLAITPDGKTLYVASPSANAITVFTRNTSTGTISQKADDAGCIADADPSCRDARSLGSPYNIAMSPDGHNLYSASYSASAITAMNISSDGTLNQTVDGPTGYGCIANTATVDCHAGPALSGPYYLTVAGDGKTVYVGGYGNSSLVALTRDTANGRLNLIGNSGQCATTDGSSGACQVVPELSSVRYLIVDKASKHVYVATEAPTVIAFDRLADGGIVRHPGTTGCLAPGGGTCTVSRALSTGNGLVLSPGGEHLYVAGGSGLEEWGIDSTGGMTTRSGTRSCTTAGAVGGCATGTGMSWTYAVQVSPDGRFLYASDTGNSNLQVFKRDSAGPTCSSAGFTVQAGSVTALPFPCSDIDGDSFTTSIIAPPTLGSLGAIDQNAHTVIYAAPQGQNGTTSFTFRSGYSGFNSGVGAIQVTVVGATGGGGGCTDVDGDGFCAGQDCNDNNAKINPSAKEIRGNNIDENCDGLAAPLPDLNSSVLPTWSVAGPRTTPIAFLLKNLKRRWKVTVTCKGAGCPFKSKKITNKKVKKGNFNALKKLGKKRTFKAGSTLTVKFSASGYNTKFAIFKFKAGKIPNGVAKCQTKGTTRLRACR